MRKLLLLAPLAALSVCTSFVEASQDRRVSFLLAMPSTKRPSPKRRDDGELRSSTAGGASSSSSAKKPRAAKSARVTNGDELVHISRRLHDRLKGVISFCTAEVVSKPSNFMCLVIDTDRLVCVYIARCPHRGSLLRLLAAHISPIRHPRLFAIFRRYHSCCIFRGRVFVRLSLCRKW